jgi:hypothetical protein
LTRRTGARGEAAAADKLMNRTSTILPPPSDFPVPMPEPAAETPESGAWRTLIETTKETVRPGTRDESATKETVKPGADLDEAAEREPR